MCERIEPDAAGRIVIPKRHQELANLGEDVVVVGCGKYLEIWDSKRWNERFNQNFKNLPTIVNELKQRGAKGQGTGNGAEG
jgi:DNA-binding transcriptional regulator/RsmH inhibitor MraZ